MMLARVAGRVALRSRVAVRSRAVGSTAWEADDGFFNAGGTVSESAFVVGESVCPAIDLRETAAGDVVDSPYELTIGTGFRDFWCSAFHTQSRLVTSRPFAQRLGFDDTLIPFDMLLFVTGAMAHADKAVDEVGYKNARYYAPANCGDTFKKRFILRSKRVPGSCRVSNTIIATFECELRNQRNELVFSVDRAMLFPLLAGEKATPYESTPAHEEYDADEHVLRKQIVASADQLGALGGVSLRPLEPGTLILHGAARRLSVTQMAQLATLGRVVHDRHSNPDRYGDEPEAERLYVPGALCLGLVNSVAGRELHEVLFQTLHSVNFVNKLHPNEVVTALTYVRSRAESVSGELEKLEVVTLGIKNIPDAAVLEAHPLPRALFLTDAPLKKNELEAALADHPLLKPENVILQSFRSLYRQAPRHEPFLL